MEDFGTLDEKIRKLAAERERIAREEEEARIHARQELERLLDQIESLEERKERLEAFLGIDDSAGRMERGRIRDLCFKALEKHQQGLTSGQLKDILARENPGLRVSSVPATLSYQMSQGRLQRDTIGRYTLVNGAN